MYYTNPTNNDLYYFDESQKKYIPEYLVEVKEPRPSPNHECIDGKWIFATTDTNNSITGSKRDLEVYRVNAILDIQTVLKRNPTILSYLDQLSNVMQNNNPAASLADLIQNRPIELR